MSVQEKAIDRAVAFLNAAGAKYTIMLGDAVVHNTIPQPEPERKIVRVKTHDFVQMVDYGKKLEAVAGGGEVTFLRADMPIPQYDPSVQPQKAQNDPWHSFKSAVSEKAKRLWTKDGFVCEHDEHRITVLRVS